MTYVNPIHIDYLLSIPLQCIHAQCTVFTRSYQQFYIQYVQIYFYKSDNILQVYKTFKHSSKCRGKHLEYLLHIKV